jgi:hypothetical protein
VPLSLLARKASPFFLHSPPVVSLQASFHRLSPYRGDAFAVPAYRKTNSGFWGLLRAFGHAADGVQPTLRPALPSPFNWLQLARIN